jgi:two-component system, OmpR family, phosphate regulon sensor histidine kinase PhoR
MGNSLRTRVILAYAVLIVVIMGSLTFYFSTFFRNTYLTDFRSNLSAETRVLADQAVPFLTSTSSPEELNLLANRYAKYLNHRITIILPDGKVIAETALSPDLLENHLSRPEVQMALKGKEGSEIRFSTTLKVNMLYLAIPVKDANGQILGVVRMANPVNQIDNNILSIQRSVLLATAIATIIAILLAILVTNYTIKPLRNLTESILKLGSGDYPEPSRLDRSDEVGNLSRAFREMSYQINNQIGQLTTEQAKLGAVLTHMNDGVLIVDSDGRVELINPAAVQLFGIEEQEATGKTLIEVVRHHQIVELWRKSAQASQQQVGTLETSPDRLFLQVIATPLEPSLPGSTLLVLQDLTRVRRLETVRRDFVSNVSHELRTPLASLKLITETLMEGALEDPVVARQFLVKMEGEIDNLSQMVRELLELSRIESGRVPLVKQIIDPVSLVRPAVERMEIQADRSGLKLVFDFPPNLPKVNADPERMEQVLVNLIHNAIKFTPPGGKITVSAYKEYSRVIFYVRDTGVGIPSADLERIFERFYKTDRSRTGGGTGLGLSISRHLVEGHGGRIWAESQLGQGSTFYFALPIA